MVSGSSPRSSVSSTSPVFARGTFWLVTAFALINLIVLLEVADRLSLKNDLEIAREIQQAMLPRAAYHAPGIEAFGMTRPANTVGGDFYDIVPLADGRVLVALGDVAGKGSPAALLMALLLAMMRTLVDEGFYGAALMTRLNAQVSKHAPASRFVTLFVAILDPSTGQLDVCQRGAEPTAAPPVGRRRRVASRGWYRARHVRIGPHTQQGRSNSRAATSS
jgi:serine phosphatase RsbU (regulator of sigma subunit)